MYDAYNVFVRFLSRSISELPTPVEVAPEEREWRVVAATHMNEKSILALTVINGTMTTLSIMQRLNCIIKSK